MTACCGINCLECGAFLATRENDDEKRAEVAKLWSKQFNVEIKPADINCEGCLSDSPNIFSHCKVCEIRSCCKDKNITNCAFCDDYYCEKLEMLFNMAPDVKHRLDELRISL